MPGPAYQPGFENADTSVTAAILLNAWYGGYWGQGPESAPESHITADAPPFFLAHGDKDDTLVPVRMPGTSPASYARPRPPPSSTPS